MYAGLKNAVGAGMAIALVIIGVMALGTGVTLAGIQISTWLSKPAGNAQVTRDTNNGTNQEAVSGQFNMLWADLQSWEVKLQQGQKLPHPDGSDEAAALANDNAACLADVATWNADTGIDTMKPYVPQGKPDSVDPSVCAYN